MLQRWDRGGEGVGKRTKMRGGILDCELGAGQLCGIEEAIKCECAHTVTRERCFIEMPPTVAVGVVVTMLSIQGQPGSHSCAV